VQEKLWVYFYLDDTVWSKDAVYAQAIELMNVLETEWLEVTFFSKEDAFGLLAKRLPDVIGSLERYNIANPLPPTLYVLFDNQEEYESMKTIISSYDNTIINLDDVTAGMAFGDQEQRIAKVINMMNLMKYLSWFLIGITVLIIVAFLLYAIRINFFRFHKQIEVEKLLGAPYEDIIAPFLLYVWLILLCAFILAGGYITLLINRLRTYFLDIFSVDFYSLLPEANILIMYVVVQLFIVLLVNIVFATGVLWKLLRDV